MCMLVFALLPVAAAQAAQNSYIRDVAMVSGSDDVSAITVDGYTSISPAIGEKNVVYRTSTAAGDAASEIVYDGGRFLCRFGTNDPIVRLYFASAKDVFAIPNNGATPVKNSAGEPVKFSTNDGPAYLMQVRENIWKPYITDIRVVKAGSKSAAIEKLAGVGCEYFVDENYGEGSSENVFIGYSRTDSESEAITDLIGRKGGDESIPGYEPVSDQSVSGLFIYASHDKAMGNPIMGIDVDFGGEAFTISAKMLTETAISGGNATMTKQYLTGSEGYESFVSSEALFLVAPMDTDGKKEAGIALISAEEGLEEKRAEKLDALGEEKPEEEKKEGSEADSAESTGEPTDAEETVGPKDGEAIPSSEDAIEEEEEQVTDRSDFDDLTEPQKGIDEDEIQNAETDETEDATEDADDQQGTVLTILGKTGAGVFFVVVLAIAVLLPVVFWLIRKRIVKKADEE